MERLEKELIEGRIENFLGYGNLNSKIWFIGMEEGLGKEFESDEKNLVKRFQATTECVSDLHVLKNFKDNKKWFGENNKVQTTWTKLIIILTSKIDKKSRLEFQSDKFGRKDGNHAILEFSSLPCCSVKEDSWKIWKNIGERESLDYLDSRGAYFSKYEEFRIEKFSKLLNKNERRIVIFYGKSKEYIGYWKGIMGPQKLIGHCLELKRTEVHHYKVGKIDFFITPQPSYLRSNEDWKKISDYINVEKLLKNN